MNGSMTNNQGIGTKTEIIDSKDTSTLIMQNQSMTNANQQQQQQQQHHQQMLSTTGVLQQPQQQQQPQQSQVCVEIIGRTFVRTTLKSMLFPPGAVVINKLLSITKLSAAHCAIQYVKLLFYVSSRLCFSVRVHGSHTKPFY